MTGSNKVTMKDIVTTPSGYYRLPCDGSHPHANHFYLYYTKPEVIRMWREEHSNTVPCVECDAPVNADIHSEELGFCLDCSNDYWEHKGKWSDD
jgi:hypothetical protein